MYNLAERLREAATYGYMPARVRVLLNEAADALSSAGEGAVPVGWQLVPKEPVPDMLGAWYRYKSGFHFPDDPPPEDTSCYGAYRAMLAAAPHPPSQDGAREGEDAVWPAPKVTNPDIANPTGNPYIDSLIHRLLDAQQDINVEANERMSQSLCDASALLDEVETAIRMLYAAPHPPRQDSLCSDCPPVGYPTDKTRCLPCPRRQDGAREGDTLADLVSRFSAALLEKLRAAEAKYGYSDAWARPDWRDDLIKHMLEHVDKGDPRDVAAYCAFAWHHGWSVKPTTPPAPDEAVEAEREACAKLVEPTGPRPCNCDWCDCGNAGDAEAVARWDAETLAAKAIRARSRRDVGGGV